MTQLGNITHSSDDLSEYTSTITDGGDLSTSAAAAAASTNFGLQMVLDDTTSIRGLKSQSAPAGNQIRHRQYIDPNGLTMADGNMFNAHQLWATTGGGVAIAVINLRRSSGNYEIRSQYREDSGGLVTLSDDIITDAYHFVEYHFVRATGVSANNGTFEVWIDGVSIGSVGSLDIFTRFNDMDNLRWGAVAGVDAGTSGTFYMDEFLWNDDGSEIGPVVPPSGGLPGRSFPRGVNRGVERGVAL